MKYQHKLKIKKGKWGRFSKIKEEFEELVDARKQKNDKMELLEVNDIIKACREYAQTLGRKICAKIEKEKLKK